MYTKHLQPKPTTLVSIVLLYFYLDQVQQCGVSTYTNQNFFFFIYICGGASLTHFSNLFAQCNYFFFLVLKTEVS